jgi:DNA-binding response OmpR family regulator
MRPGLAKLLIIEDARDVAKMMAEWLTFSDFIVDICHDGNDASERLRRNKYDLVILDLGLPGVDGVDILGALRESGNQTPVMVVSGRGAIESKVACLELGADDYMTKPFHFRELVSRTKALLRRQAGYASNILTIGNMSINWTTKQVMVDGKEIKLTPQEFSLLQFLAIHPNCTFSSHDLLDRVWDSADDLSTATVRTCVKRLRQKLSEYGQADTIETLAAGYRLNAPEKTAI